MGLRQERVDASAADEPAEPDEGPEATVRLTVRKGPGGRGPVGTGIIRRFRVPAPVSDKKAKCVAGPWSCFLRSHPCGSLGFCVAAHGHRTSHVKRILPGE